MKIDPTQKRDQHCKTYLEKDVVDAIKSYQLRNMSTVSSFSEALRSLVLHGLSSEERCEAQVTKVRVFQDMNSDPRTTKPGG